MKYDSTHAHSWSSDSDIAVGHKSLWTLIPAASFMNDIYTGKLNHTHTQWYKELYNAIILYLVYRNPVVFMFQPRFLHIG